jgi:hypothetical protein
MCNELTWEQEQSIADYESWLAEKEWEEYLQWQSEQEEQALLVNGEYFEEEYF